MPKPDPATSLAGFLVPLHTSIAAASTIGSVIRVCFITLLSRLFVTMVSSTIRVCVSPLLWHTANAYQLDKLVGLAMLVAASIVFLYYTIWTLLMVGLSTLPQD